MAERLGALKDIRKYLDVLYSFSELVFKECTQKFKHYGGIRVGAQMSSPLFNGTADLGNEDLDQNLQYMINEEVGIQKDYLQMMSGSGYNGPPILGRLINTKI